MLDFFQRLFASDFMPHGYCMRWSSEVVWLHVFSDALTALAYYIIPFGLVYFVRRRKDLAFNWMFVAFGLFILACGTTHLMAIFTLWKPLYRLDGVVKAVTGASSIVTAFLLIRLIPEALRIPTPESLRAEIAERKKAQEELRELNATLEERVLERTAALQRQNQAFQRVAYISSHDLREPLRMVTLYSQLALTRYADKLDNTGREYLEHAVSGSLRMQSLVDDLLEFSKIVERTSEPELTAVSCGEAVRGALRNLRLAIEEAQASVTVENDLPDVCAEPLQLQQTFQNLLSNSIKYRSPERPLEVHISGERRPDGFVAIHVRDNGIGFDMKYADRVFEAFRRLHGQRIPGTGVGLAICKNIVESFGGTVEAASAPNQGATFSIVLKPARRPPDGNRTLE